MGADASMQWSAVLGTSFAYGVCPTSAWAPLGEVIAPENGMSALAAVLRTGVESGAPELELLRDIIQCSDDFARLSRDDDRRAFIAEPAATGDARYDAFLAGLAVHFCREAGLETTPSWTRDESRYLDRRVAEASAR